MTQQSLRDIAHQHGGDYRNGAAFIPTPGHSKNDRGTVIRERSDGGGLYVHCFQDPAAGLEVKRELGLDHQKPRKPLTKAERRAYAQRKAQEDAERETDQLARAAALWNHGRTLRLSDPAGVYLTEARCIPAETVLEAIDAGVMRYCELWGRPSLLVLAQRVSDGAPRAVQATRVKRDGSAKADIPNPRLSFGPVKGTAVRLSLDMHAVAEGVETALSFRSLHDCPTWATLGTAQLGAFTPPPGAKRLIIAADGDLPTSEAAAVVRDAIERLRADYRVQFAPAPEGKDWNDVQRGEA